MSDKVVPRAAASILLMRDDPFEVLMMRRGRGGTFASALVFPGGTASVEDASADWLPHLADGADLPEAERAIRVTACRETFEETGLLLAVDAAGRAVSPAVCDPAVPFLDVVRASGGHLFLDSLVPFGHWITPDVVPRRYDTRFFLCAAPAGQEAVCDGAEAVSLSWHAPRRLVDGTELRLPFPTRMNLHRLAESQGVAQALAAARARPAFTVRPLAEERPDGLFVVIPAEAGYAETESRRPNRNIID